jgi:hypothetical protein
MPFDLCALGSLRLLILRLWIHALISRLGSYALEPIPWNPRLWNSTPLEPPQGLWNPRLWIPRLWNRQFLVECFHQPALHQPALHHQLSHINSALHHHLCYINLCFFFFSNLLFGKIMKTSKRERFCFVVVQCKRYCYGFCSLPAKYS